MQKMQKFKKRKKIKWQKNIFAGVVVIIVVVVVVVDVDLLDLFLLLQIFFHAKSGGCSFKIDWVMANLVQLKFWQTRTDWQISPLYSSEINKNPKTVTGGPFFDRLSDRNMLYTNRFLTKNYLSWYILAPIGAIKIISCQPC